MKHDGLGRSPEAIGEHEAAAVLSDKLRARELTAKATNAGGRYAFDGRRKPSLRDWTHVR
jgi:hypothetical protein